MIRSNHLVKRLVRCSVVTKQHPFRSNSNHVGQTAYYSTVVPPTTNAETTAPAGSTTTTNNNNATTTTPRPQVRTPRVRNLAKYLEQDTSGSGATEATSTAAAAATTSQGPRASAVAAKKTGGAGEQQQQTPGGNPYRFPLAWKDPEFYDKESLERETRRVFEICNGCRRCYSLCNSFPRLFDIIDRSPSGDMDTVPSTEFKSVVDDCTLCDMCFLTKCPYVPPHSFNIDFPHLMLRYKAVENKSKNEKHIVNDLQQQQQQQQQQPSASTATATNTNANTSTNTKKTAVATVKETSGYLDNTMTTKLHVTPDLKRDLAMEEPSWAFRELVKTDRNGKLATMTSWVSSLANYAASHHNKNMLSRFARPLLEKVLGVDRRAKLPEYALQRLTSLLPATATDGVNKAAPAYGSKRKAVIYATCIGEYNNTKIGLAAYAVLRHNGVETIVKYPQCCGMPQLEQGDIAAVTASAKNIAAELNKYIDQGYDIITLVASCSLMFKHEWKTLLPEDEAVKKLSAHTFDISEYVCDIAKKEGLADGLQPIPYKITLHHACHSRAQSMGNKGLEMIRHIPKANVKVIERCSGHGGSWGCKKKHFDTAIKIGKPVAQQALKNAELTKVYESVDPAESSSGLRQSVQCRTCVSSECPLAADHIAQGVEMLVEEQQQQKKQKQDDDDDGKPVYETKAITKHPIEILAEAYQIDITQQQL